MMSSAQPINIININGLALHDDVTV